ncbi:MAG: hypothetical protein WC548_01200 [Candidatus Pacearchaeota archaeon]
MAQSSDEIIKREILDYLGTEINGLTLWIFPQSSNEDQKPFGDNGGLTFGVGGITYGSCDACWVKKENWVNPLNNRLNKIKPFVALEGTDALNRGSSGNAQYQRFHHALGAVKAGLIGIYYLKKGKYKIQEDLFGMAYYASKIEKGNYIILDDLEDLKNILLNIGDTTKLNELIDYHLNRMLSIFKKSFEKRYGNWENFARKRSTIIKGSYVIKYSGRMKRNFTDGSQRAGHIALGEMYLTKYFFPNKHIFYLWPKMEKQDLAYLDTHKSSDKEWRLLRNETNVTIITLEDLENVPKTCIEEFKAIKDIPLKSEAIKIFNRNMFLIKKGILEDTIKIRKKLVEGLSINLKTSK